MNLILPFDLPITSYLQVLSSTGLLIFIYSPNKFGAGSALMQEPGDRWRLCGTISCRQASRSNLHNPTCGSAYAYKWDGKLGNTWQHREPGRFQLLWERFFFGGYFKDQLKKKRQACNFHVEVTEHGAPIVTANILFVWASEGHERYTDIFVMLFLFPQHADISSGLNINTAVV